MTTPKKSVAIPKFRSEAEEAKWWDGRPEAATKIMKNALKSGRAPLKTVTIRIPAPDIQAAKELAQEKGLPYQIYMKMLLHEALKREGPV